MNNVKLLIVISSFLLTTVVLYAQSQYNQEVPEGMEAVQIGGSAWLVIPKGAKTRKIGAQIIVEGTKEYVARRFEENDARLDNIEKTLVNLTKEIEALKKLNGTSKSAQ